MAKNIKTAIEKAPTPNTHFINPSNTFSWTLTSIEPCS